MSPHPRRLTPAALVVAAALAAPGALRAQSGPHSQRFLFSSVPVAGWSSSAAVTSLEGGYAEHAFRGLAPERVEVRAGLHAALGRRVGLLARVGMVPDGADAGVEAQASLELGLLSGRRGALALGVGGGREYGGAGVALAHVSAVRSGRDWLLGGSVGVEHPFASGRDAADVLTSVGYERRLLPALAVGLEGVAEDLEGLVERDEAEGGARLMLGPTLALGGERSHWLVLLGGGPVLRVNRNDRVSPAQRQLDGSGFVLRLALRHR